MTNTSEDSWKILQEAFAHSINWVWILGRDAGGPPGIGGLTNAMMGECPVFLFTFEEREKYLAIGHARNALRVVWVDPQREALDQFADSLSEEDLECRTICENMELVSAVDITPFIMPIDKVASIRIRAQKLIVVRSDDSDIPEGIVAIMIWFEHGFKLALLIGYYNELTTLFGDAVDAALENAISMKQKYKLTITEHEYFPTPPSHYDVINNSNWFDWRNTEGGG